MIELQRIYGIMSSFLGESKQGGYNNDVTQYQFNCPYCADEKGYIDNKFNGEVSLSLMKYHCWSCGHSGSLSRIIKRWGGKNELKEYYSIINDLKENHLYEISDSIESEKETPQLQLPITYKKINLKNCRNKELKAYLKKRCIDQWTINKFNIGYTEWEKDDKAWSNRIIIPSFNEFGNLNYFVGRDYLPENKKKNETSLSSPFNGYQRPKYKNCDADKKEIVFQENLIDWDADIYICEGAIDCLMVPNGLSLLGKTLQKDSKTYKSLYEKANASIIICLDADTKIEETKKIYSLLDVGRLKGKIKYIRLGENGAEGKDFSEIFEKRGISGIVQTLRCAKKFKETDLLF